VFFPGQPQGYLKAYVTCPDHNDLQAQTPLKSALDTVFAATPQTPVHPQRHRSICYTNSMTSG
jgi:hypothetical protein